MAKGLVTPGVLFEELGFTLRRADRRAQSGSPADHPGRTWPSCTGPVLLHVVTTKGKGYAPAEGDAVKWHGAAPFEVETGAFKKKAAPMTYTEAFAQALIRLADEDDRIVAHHRRHGRGDRAGQVPEGASRRGSSTSGSPSSTPWSSPPAWPRRDCGRWRRSTRPSCSAATTRWSTTCVSSGCRWSSPWIGPGSSGTMGPRTKGSTTWRSSGRCPT